MTELTRRAVLGALPVVAAMPVLAQAAWPTRPISMAVGFAAGGPTDVVSRIVAQALSRRLGQQIIVENRPGATGMTAASQIARALPDGYTLLAIPATYAASAALFRTLSFRPVQDLETISITVEFPYVWVTHADHPIRTIAELVHAAQSRSQHDLLTYGTSGVGSLQHLSVEHFAKMANVKLQHIPYRGGAPAITDLLGKRIDFVVDPPAALIEFIRDGRLRGVAVTGEKRFFGLPEAPTISEAGFPEYAVTGWQGLVAPAGLPTPVLGRLHAELTGVLMEPGVIEQLKALGNEPKSTSPDEFRTRLAAEVDRWAKVIAAANIERI